jgi:hypothetical protein
MPMPATPPDQTSLCPRCESTFDCGVLSGSCWCAKVALDDAVRADLVRFYEGCLCSDCLKLIAEVKPPRPSVRSFLASQLRRKTAR